MLTKMPSQGAYRRRGHTHRLFWSVECTIGPFQNEPSAPAVCVIWHRASIRPLMPHAPTVIQQNPARPKKVSERDPVAVGTRDAAVNRAASHNYFLTDRFEAGIALRGTEVKSIREGKANLKDAYGLVKDGEAFLLNAHIGHFSHGNEMNHEETRTRKLLLHKEELRRLTARTKEKGYTLIPTRLYFKGGRVKCELALARGKQDWDKRETERNREADREARAAIARSQRR
jgi:SsrA-binding protein